MFKASTKRIERIRNAYQQEGIDIIPELEHLFRGRVRMYIDHANIRPWSDKLAWHVDVRRLRQFIFSFDNVLPVKVYAGTLIGDKNSQDFIEQLRQEKYEVRTKPVKIMKRSIDVSSIPENSPALLESFIRNAFLRKLNINSIILLNKQLKALNASGEYYIEERKCNFDVEIGRDILLDHAKNGTDTFVLWSGDSDFAEPLEELLKDGKRVIVFSTARRVASELNELRKQGLLIFDIQKIRDYICRKEEISKGDLPKEAPKL